MDAVAAGVLGTVERLVGAVDQAGDGLPKSQFGDADGYGDAAAGSGSMHARENLSQGPPQMGSLKNANHWPRWRF